MKLKKNWMFFLLIFAICAGKISAVNYDDETLVKVGLKYGNGSSFYANTLGNEGYEAGVINSDGLFAPLIMIDNRYLTIAIDDNYYYGNDKISQSENLGKEVGGYNLKTTTSFPTSIEANEFANKKGLKSYFISYENGSFFVQMGNFMSENDANNAKGNYPVETAVCAPQSSRITVIDLNNGTTVYEYLGSEAFALSPRDGKIKTGANYYGGVLAFPINNGKVNTINHIKLEEYLKGVVPYEMSPSWHIEALKAQAVAARNFTLKGMNRHKGDGFNLCSTVHCQAYNGSGGMHARTNQAVDETKGVVLTYNGELAEAFYHSSSGGFTERTGNIWYEDLPYIKGAETPYEYLENVPDGIWSFELTKEELTTHFRSKGYDIGNVTDFYVSRFTEVGNVYSITVVDDRGKKTVIEKEKARLMLNPYAKSQRFTISPNFAYYVNDKKSDIQIGANYVLGGDGQAKKMEIPSSSIEVATKTSTSALVAGGATSFVIDGRGRGNNVGMSQWSAKGMAENGWTYERILTHFLEGTQVTRK